MRRQGGYQRRRHERVVVSAMMVAVIVAFLFIFYHASQLTTQINVASRPGVILSKAYRNQDVNPILQPLRDGDIKNNQTITIPEEKEALIHYIWKNYLIVYGNSKDNYHLDHPFIEDPSPKVMTQLIVRHFFDYKQDGVFVEYRARDGETGSHSLFLELHLGWRGLLIEPDLKLYQKLLAKNRKVWMSNTCLSTKPHPYWGLIEDGTVIRNVIDAGRKPGEMRSSDTEYDIHQVQCIPLYYMLVAVELKEIDILFIDVETEAYDILFHTNLDVIPIKVVVVVLYDKEADRNLTLSLHTFMRSKGYGTVSTVKTGDSVFQHTLVFSKIRP